MVFQGKKFPWPSPGPEMLRWACRPCTSWCEETTCVALAAAAEARAIRMTQERAASTGDGMWLSPAPSSLFWAQWTPREKEGKNVKGESPEWRGLSTFSEDTEYRTRETELLLVGKSEGTVACGEGIFSYWEVRILQFLHIQVRSLEFLKHCSFKMFKMESKSFSI